MTNLSEFDPFAGPAIALVAPTTEAQREIWTAVQMGADVSLAFNEAGVLRLEGALEVAALAAALADLVARHESLRSTFSADGLQVTVLAPAAFPLARLDLTAHSESERAAQRAKLHAQQVSQPFDLERGPLVRATLVHLTANVHELVLTVHHAVCDGYSTGVLLKDLGALYTARSAGRPAPLAAPVPYRAYGQALAQRAGTAEQVADEAYWVARFRELPPNLELPGDRLRPARRRLVAARLDRVLDAALVASLRQVSRQLNASFFTTLFGGFAALLHRLSGQTDLVSVIPSAGQAAAGFPTVVGHCVNALPVRVAVAPEASFKTLVAATRAALLDAQEHGQYTLGQLLRVLPVPRDPARLPLAAVCFNLDLALAGPALGFAGLSAAFAAIPRQAENFDLFVNAVDAGQTVVLETQYATDLFDAATVHGWLDTFAVLLRAAAEQPETPVSRLPVLSPAAQASLAAWNQTAAEIPRATPEQLVAQIAQQSPDAVAAVWGDQTLRFGNLNRRANQLARLLRERGVGPGVLVGLCLERTPDLLVALVAVHRAGGGYLPLDPGYPVERLAYLLESSRAPVLLTQEQLKDLIPFQPPSVLLVDAAAALIAAQSAAAVPPAPGASPEDVAYVIYTSGSTGKPKGVVVPLRAMQNLLAFTREKPGMSATDTVVALTTLSFDIAVFELWLPMTVGARVVLAERDAGADGAALLRLVEAQRVTVLQATPTTWRLLLAAGWEPKRTVKLITTGEAMPRDLGTELRSKSPDVWDMYGPTETCVWSTWWQVPDPVGTVLIGKPIANTQVHVLDQQLQLVPVGVVGELWIGGTGVALGYLNQPELTAERFVPDPFRPGSVLYRTGDQGRWRHDGQLEYLGRNDQQVKIRGFRIELGEIEATLGTHPAVRQAVVLAREDRPGDVRLVAYTVPRAGQTLADEALRRHLRATLPEYLIPQHFVALERLPVTPNGKVDRKALPAPDPGGRGERQYVAPQNAAERLVAALWQDALGVPRVSIHDDFFGLGGHSLLAAQIIGRLAREHGISLPMRKMFEAPTVAQFAPLLAGERQTVEIPRLPAGAPAPASFMQERTWNLEQLNPGRAIFNLPAAFRLVGDLDHGALARSLHAFYLRHEATRTTLRAEGGAVVQVVAADMPVALPLQELSGLPEPAREAELMRLLLEESKAPFDLVGGPLVRTRLYRLGSREHVVYFMPHHAIWDGWSFDVLVRDWAELYAAEREGRAAQLPALPLRYRDFAAWHRSWLSSPEVAKQARYWRQQLAGAPAALELPADKPRPRFPGDAGATLWVDIPRAEADALTALAQRHGDTLYLVMLAAWATVLYRLSGQEELLIGTPVRGRSQPHTEDLVGTFINTLVLRLNLAGAPTFHELLARVRRVVMEAFANEDVPFELLAMSDKPAFRALFSFQDARQRPASFGGLALRQVQVLPPTAANDVSLWIMEQSTGLIGGLNFSTELFAPATMERLLSCFRAILTAVAANSSLRVDQIVLAAAAEAARVAGPSATPALPLLPTLLQRAAAAPPALAVTGAGGSLSLGELCRRAAGVATRLREAGVQAGQRVVLLAPPSTDGTVGIVAIALAGGTCVPLDPAWPALRLARFVATAQPAAVLATAPGGEGLREYRGPVLPLAAAASAVPAAAALPDLAAVLFVPEASGAPQALELSWTALSASVTGAARLAELQAEATLLCGSSLASGYGLVEAWLALVTGARLVLDGEAFANPELLPEASERWGASAIHASAWVWERLGLAGWQGHRGLTALCTGAATGTLGADLLARVARVVVLLGGAEVGLWCGGARLTAQTAPGACGSPFAEVAWSVGDNGGQILPKGLPGELLVQGPTLARRQSGRSGQRVRLRTDGTIEWLGYCGAHGSLRGERFAPLEIEAVLRRHPAVAAAAVAPRRDSLGEERLVAWVVRRAGQDATDSELRAHLRDYLPAAWVPRRIVELEELPGGTAGPDHARLPSPFPEGTRQEYLPPRTAPEQLLAEIWRQALAVPRVGLNDNFFDLGGHSLLCLQVVAEIEKRTGKKLSPRTLLLNTLAQVAGELARADGPDRPART